MGQWQESSTDLDGGEKSADFTLNYNHALSGSDSLGLTLFGYDTVSFAGAMPARDRWRTTRSPA